MTSAGYVPWFINYRKRNIAVHVLGKNIDQGC